jgi:hypothetical protein
MAELDSGVIPESIDDTKEDGTDFRKVIGVDEREEISARQVFRIPAEESNCGSILGNDLTASVDDCNQIGCAVEKGLKSHLAEPQILLCAAQKIRSPTRTDDGIDLTGGESIERVLRMGQT